MIEINISLVFIIIFVLFVIILIYFLLKSLKKEEKRLKPSSYKCIDGHVVKSKGELIIDNFLHLNGIEHEYEKKIKVKGNPIKCDWYLPEHEIYMEYWGFFGKKYLQRKKEKLNLYHKGKLKLISIEEIMFKDIYTNLTSELKKFIDESTPLRKIKHCPNCGIELDERF